MRFFATILFFLFFVCRVQAGGITATQLTCEQTVNPLGIDLARPAFGWQLRSAERGQFQTAFEMIVGDRAEQVLAGTGNVWQTGKRNSAENSIILFEGKQLRSFTRYFWKVRVYDRNGKASEWSPVAWFETAMLSAADWKAQWISDGQSLPGTDAGFYKDDPMPVFKQAVAVTKPVKTARLYIAGAGYFEAYLNGEKIGKDWLSPGWTNFDKRILYRVYDITANLRKGRNIAGLMLGNGWYNPLPMRFWGVYNLRNALATGRPVVKAQLRVTYTDGTTETINTDNSWKWKAGPVIRNSVYLGETFDGRADTKAWLQQVPESGDLPAAIANGPKGKLQADLQPPVRVAAVIKPVAVTEVAPGKFVADMGVNFAGVARIRVKAPQGTRISLRYGEDVYKDGNVNGMTAVAGQIKNGNGGPEAPPVAWQEDHFIAGGGGMETWNPRFTFHVFRYVELTGWPGKPTVDDIEGLQMHADVPDAGVFECSNRLFNKIQELTLRTFKSNIFSVQSDCAGREKFGYGGDLFCTLESFSYNFDMYNFYRKSLQDFEDDQRPLGGITETAPYVGLHDKGPGDASGPLGWQLGYPYLVKKLYEFYGDKRVIETYYPSLTKQIRFLEDRAKGFLYEEDISDHESLDPKPVALTASLFFFHHVQLMREFSELLNKKAEADRYAALEAKIRAAIRKRFYKGAGIFDNQTQAAQLFALWYDIAEEKEKQAVLRQLVQAFAAKNNHVSTGIFATKMLFDVLRVHNLDTLAYTIVNQKDFPGWGHMVAQGATTLWETWKYSDNTYSQNHPMFGSVSEWFYRSLLGINATAPGFKTFRIQPRTAGLSFAKGWYRSPYGTIGSSWEQHADNFLLHVEIPVNTMAEVWIPAAPGSVLLDGKKAGAPGTVVFLKEAQGYQVYKVASGTYTFSCRLK
ncbi:glycoside hydrolase family 78 protein [Niabella pedocola]|uniref:alpha-L-rhamnosidase n=1 Tax=Niabella pedocola TaxID=1752077 RepID=A0ABS8PYX3_9BACT|nr:alpha-L-rhamnosidase [Niabella pedocola]MCD2426085.1 glycoside hydrolase family 78 protein [Niabella pedocola]